MIAIVNYGLGNLGSIENMLKRMGIPAYIANTPADLGKATKIILPGVGAFDTGMKHLKNHAWIDPLSERVMIKKMPVLGICLGMQLMTHASEEGVEPGLGWVDAVTIKFPSSVGRVPHMGWNVAHIAKDSRLLTDEGIENRFYFVHSYFVKLNKPSDELLNTVYSVPFTSGFETNNILGVQFHPEKSHRFGMKLLSNFATRY